MGTIEIGLKAVPGIGVGASMVYRAAKKGKFGDVKNRGSGTLREVFSSKANGAGGELVTSNGNIVQSQVSSEVQRALYQNKNVDILSGVHGFSNGTMKKELGFFADDVKVFGNLPGVTVHNLNSMSKTQIQNVMKNDSTVLGAFCHSGACLKP